MDQHQKDVRWYKIYRVRPLIEATDMCGLPTINVEV